MVAHEMNFFHEEGLTDEFGEEGYRFVLGGLAPFTFEKETLQQAMKEQGADVAMDVHPSTVAHTRTTDKGLPKLVIIAGWRNNNPNCLVAQPEFTSLESLRGKGIGCIDEKDNLVGALSPVLKREGLDPRTAVNWVRGWAPQKNTKALRERVLDAAFIPTIDVPPLEQDGFNNLFNIVEEYPNGRPDRIIVATQQALDQKRDALRSFLKGMLRAYWFIRTMPENYQYLRNLEIRLRRQSFDPDERTRPLVNGSPAHSEILPFPYDARPTQLDAYLAEAVDLGELDSAPPADTLVDLSVLEEAFAELDGRADVKASLDRAREVHERWGF
ncbi:MAG TPA: ABC transporter substrate-binding protein [Acidimicrobiia bacterium]|jgi:hypothetical protein